MSKSEKRSCKHVSTAFIKMITNIHLVLKTYNMHLVKLGPPPPAPKCAKTASILSTTCISVCELHLQISVPAGQHTCISYGPSDIISYRKWSSLLTPGTCSITTPDGLVILLHDGEPRAHVWHITSDIARGYITQAHHEQDLQGLGVRGTDFYFWPRKWKLEISAVLVVSKTWTR